jgi:transcription factor E
MITQCRKVFNVTFSMVYMQVGLLKEIVTHFAGAGSVGIVDLLHNKKNVNEFLIAKKLNLTINQTRNILYKLADEGLVSFIRKKDSKKGGWYTYFWTLNTGKSLSKFRDKLMKDVGKLKQELGQMRAQTFYYSEGAELIYTEEQALLNDYTCPETGEVLVIRDNAEPIKIIEKEDTRLEVVLEEINVDLEVVNKKDEQALVRKLKLEEKKKKEKRAATRLANAKKRAAENKRLGIVVKKKVVKKKKKVVKKKKKAVKKKAVKKKAKKAVKKKK